MRVTVVFDGRRQLFEDVEQLTFEDFLQAVGATFDMSIDSFDVLLGNNAIDLALDEHLNEFGVISGDLLYVRRKQPGLTNVPKPKTAIVAIPSTSVSTPMTSTVETTLSMETCLSTLSDNEELNVYVLNYVEQFMENAKFQVTQKTFLPNTVTPMFISSCYEHSHSPALSVELTLNLFRDNHEGADGTLDNRVTSIELFSMLIVKEKRERYFLESLQLYRSSHNIDAELENVILQPLKKRILGPDDPLLRTLSVVDVMLKIAQFLAPKDLLHLEGTCKYANWRLRSSCVLDEQIWKRHLKERFGESIVPSTIEHPNTYRGIFQQKVVEQRRISTSRFRPPENIFFFPMEFWPHPSRAERNEPPAPFPQPPVNHPFNNPLDPFTGGLILPQRQPHLPGGPRIYPRQPNWPDPLAQPPGNFPDPDMPQGPMRGPHGGGGIGPFPPRLPGRRGGGQGGGWPPFGFY